MISYLLQSLIRNARGDGTVPLLNRPGAVARVYLARLLLILITAAVSGGLCLIFLTLAKIPMSMEPGLSLISVLTAAYTVFILCVSSAAAFVALTVNDASRRADGYLVLKLVLGVGTVSGGVAGIAIKLHEIGLL